MRILSIETSCDETSVALVEDGIHVLSNIIASSSKDFSDLGGVIPEEAARKQIKCILPVVSQALKQAKTSIDDVDAIAVTRGPGLLVSLLVGTTVARTISSIHKKPLIGVHHTLGHLSSTWLDTIDEPQFPILSLSASGGHSDLWLRTSHTKGQLLGSTRDDAAGEAFDKGATLLGLPYPGGPSISLVAEKGNIDAYRFPNPLHDKNTLDFSFSGLKTSLKYMLREIKFQNPYELNRKLTTRIRNTKNNNIVFSKYLPKPSIRQKSYSNRRLTNNYKLHDIAASYQHAICRHLTNRIMRAIKHYHEIKEIHLVGGVSANIHLRKLVNESIPHITLRTPTKIVYCTDNAAMIGSAAYFMWTEFKNKTFNDFETDASIPLNDVVDK